MPDSLSIKEIIDKYGTYTGLTMGTSMRPLLHQQKDNIIVVKPKGRLKKYDVALYVTDYGKYIMHRVVEVHPDHYIITGDNLLAKEYVTDDMICGKLFGRSAFKTYSRKTSFVKGRFSFARRAYKSPRY